MSYSKKLQDLVDELTQYDERFQKVAVKDLLRILDWAEQDRADSHLSRTVRREVKQERTIANFQRLYGKDAADELRQKLAAIKRDDYDDL